MLPPLNRMPRLLLLAALLLLPLAGALAQAASDSETETFRLAGPSGEYDVEVTFPPGYDRARGERLPALYYLDGWRNAALVKGVHRIAMTIAPGGGEQPVRPFLLVGVSTVGGEAAFQKGRNKDYTPTPYIVPRGVTLTMGEGTRLDSAGTGGAAAFASFLREAVIPQVEARYPADPSQRALSGHSFGGLFGAWMMEAHPDLFADYLLLSPSLFWDRAFLLDAAFERARARGARVFLGVGDDERGVGITDLAGQAERFAATLESEPGLAVTLRVYSGADHQGVLPPGYWDGILALYGR